MASIAAIASMANPNFIVRKEPSIVASGIKLFIKSAGCSVESNRRLPKLAIRDSD
jgi:hypothetical protein